MILRAQYLETIRERLRSFPVVLVLGPRQVGKTTLARTIAHEQVSHFFDLEDVDALARLAVNGAFSRVLFTCSAVIKGRS